MSDTTRPQRPFTTEQLRYLREYYPGLSDRPPGVDLGAVLAAQAGRSRNDYDPGMDHWLATLATIYVRNTAHASTQNDGTLAKPFATIAEAVLTVPRWRKEARVVVITCIQTGIPYKLPAADPVGRLDRFTIVGALPASPTGLSSIAVDTVNDITPAVGGYDIDLTLDSRAEDDMRELFFTHSGGRNGWCFQNAVSGGGTTNVRLTQDRDGGAQTPAANTFDFHDPAEFVQIDLDGYDLGINWTNQLQFETVSFVDSSGNQKGIVTQAGARVTFVNCHFDKTINRVTLFEAECLIGLRNCYFATTATSAKFGQLAVNRAFGTFLNLRSGNVFDGVNSGSTNHPICAHEGIMAGICFQGMQVFRGCKSALFDGHTHVGLNEGYNSNKAIYVYDHDAASPIVHFGQRIDTAYHGGLTGQQLPDLYGTIDHDYCLSFENCSPRLGRGTAVTCDASGSPITNQVSGDDGATACCGTAFHRSWCTLDRDTDVAGWERYDDVPAAASPAVILDGKNGPYQHLDLTASTGTPTVDFRELQIGGWLDLFVTQAATALTITWTAVDWAGGTAPVIGNAAVGMVRLHWDGTTIRGQIIGNVFS